MAKMRWWCGSWLMTMLFAPFAAQAAPFIPGPCSLDAIQITRIIDTPFADDETIYGGAINATKCFGVEGDANDDQGGRSEPSPNIGHLYDGFLNGEPSVQGGTLDPYFFIDSPAGDDSPSLSTPHDIPGNPDTDDPGWIHLARINSGGTNGADAGISYSQLGAGAESLNIGDLLTIIWQCGNVDCGSGLWSLMLEPDIVDRVTALLGPNAFDHLAISVKQSNGLAVYDFDFTILSQPGNALAGIPIDFVTPYSFEGQWSMKDFGQQDDSFSHINIWARDPLITTQRLPVPVSWTLILAGLVALTVLRRRPVSWAS